jgi:hypothetical protein
MSMNSDLNRWLAAERDERDKEADAAFKAVFRTAPLAAAPAFVDGVMEAIARDAAIRRRRARIAAAAGLAASILLGLVTTVALIAKGPRLIVWAVDSAIAATVWMSGAVENGLDLWGILGQIASAAAAVIATPQVASVLIAIQAIGAAALYGLHRILASEQESS